MNKLWGAGALAVVFAFLFNLSLSLVTVWAVAWVVLSVLRHFGIVH